MEKDYFPITPEFADAALNLLADPNFKPAPLFPNSERLEDLFGLCEIYEDGSCSLDRKE